MAQDIGDGMSLYWGDMHTQFKPQWTRRHWPTFLEDSFRYARDYLDFYAIVYYPAIYHFTDSGLKLESVGAREHCAEQWRLVCDLVKKHHEPGRFVTFPGYEWNGDRTRWGDHNVFYPFDDPPLDLTMDLPDLYDHLREAGGVAIPHHTGYAPRDRGKDWDCWDEEVSPFAEILSGHGSSEGCNTPIGMHRNMSMGPRTAGGTIQDGLARGYRVGIMASGDNNSGFPGKHGTGLMACYAEELTRESLWEAFGARRVYGVTGDRMRLDFRINDAFMGGVIEGAEAVQIEARVIGSQAIDRIELLRNNRVIATHCHNGTWEPPESGTVRVKLQIEHGWGPNPGDNWEVGRREWRMRLTGEGITVRGVEGCFSYGGQSIDATGDHAVEYTLSTAPRSTQSIIVELEGDVTSTVRLEGESVDEAHTLGELMEHGRLIVLRDEVRRMIREQFDYEFTPDDPEQGDATFHNAYKVKLHTAIPEAGYTASLSVRDDDLQPGWSWYYLRVSQLNEQYAWSSPIWIDG